MTRMADAPNISREEILQVFPAVARTVAETLACDAGEVALAKRLVEDLGAESIDLLDLLFRLEDEFGVEIPEGGILEHVRGNLSEPEFERDGYLTDAALDRLKAYLTEIPADEFPSRLNVADVHQLFTVETFCKIVVRALHQKDRGGPP